jgi:hypothetical protein
MIQETTTGGEREALADSAHAVMVVKMFSVPLGRRGASKRDLEKTSTISDFDARRFA